MIIIGDVHGKFDQYRQIVEAHSDSESIQVGDFGIGFGVEAPVSPASHKFIRGNHDDPDAARAHKNYLGEWGMTASGVFYIGGAKSIDRDGRLPGSTWWCGEELGWEELRTAIDAFARWKPRYVVSHAAPVSIAQRITHGTHRSTTEDALEEMFSKHSPRLWVFGHYHRPESIEQKGTRFVCLNELQTLEL